jgi:orotidine-5'-phosphate decarboxylase
VGNVCFYGDYRRKPVGERKVMRMNNRDKLIVALDVEEAKAIALIEELSPVVNVFKIGIAPFTGFGETLLKKLEKKKKKVFLDLKVHDIPNTVKNAAREAAKKNVLMMNFHCIGGKTMMAAAVEGAREVEKGQRPLLLGVTVLTSMGEDDLKEIGLSGNPADNVVKFAKDAKEAGLDGVVASAKETRLIKEACGEDFVVVTPGIRPAWAQANDQKRAVTPREAINNGSDYIVIGRPIIQADDPKEAVEKIIEEMEG